MIVLQAKDLTISFGGQKVFDEISLAINEKERIGLVGVNGSGKSTLLKCLTRELEPDKGDIYISSQTTYAYLEQLPDYDIEKTAWEVVMDSFEDLLAMRQTLRELESKMARADEQELDKIMAKYAEVTEAYELNNGYLCESMAQKILTGLGFSEEEYSRPIKTFSGGQKTRLNIARLLALEPDILYLDEPTNHLDMSSVEWLEEHLQNYKGTIIVVSHDRMFLDKTATRILELSNRKLYSYPGNYSNYLKQKALISAAWEKAYQKQQAYIKKTEAYIARYKAGIKSKQAQGRQKQLDRLERIENVAKDATIAPWEFKLQQDSGQDVLKAEDLAKSYNDELLFSKVNIHLRKGDKVAVVGPNGCGKTTLLKIILGQVLPDRGNVNIGSRIIMGYFSQEFENLNQERTVLDEIIYSFDITIEQARTLLGRMLFTGDDVLKTISSLSGGEKARIAILKLLLTGANFLILDDPTNHLDIESRLVVEDMLANYPGTILMVSHDRYFIDQIVNQLLVFEKKTIKHFLGNYSEYHHQKVMENLNQPKDVEKKKPSEQQLKRIEDKEKARIERRLKRDLSEVEDKIADLEQQIAIIETDLADPQYYADVEKVQELSQKLEALNNELDMLYEKWEELMSRV
ncbi:MAG: ABC-F family ATP-binding cassette domain-containing protein [Syntrophomonadaceae bacterium]|nr:ABC-F family ATP-binding cassette domain-containing protein [Syntrophomonadaceae bacterium]